MNAKERILGKLRASLAGTTAVADDYDIGLVTDPWRYAADERIARLRRMLEAVHGETLLTTAAEWPQRVLEALAAGLPVVGPSRGGISELIDEHVGQRAVSVDPAGMAEAIEALFARDMAELKRAARRRAEQRHRWDNTFEGLTRLYGELVAQRSAVEIVPLRA